MNQQSISQPAMGFPRGVEVSPCGIEPIRMPEVTQWIQNLGNEIERFGILAASLEEVLSPILKKSGVGAQIAASPEPVLVPLASELRTMSNQLNSLNAALEDMRSNIEL